MNIHTEENTHIDEMELIDSRILELYFMPLEDLEKGEIRLQAKAKLLVDHHKDLSEAFYEDLVNELTEWALIEGTPKKFR